MDAELKALLLSGRDAGGQSRLKTDVVPIPGVGDVPVRELTRYEMIKVFGLNGDRVQQDRVAVAFGCDLREDEVALWQKAAGNAEIERIAEAINGLSGIGKGAAKSDVPGDGDGRGDGVRALPGAEAGDDGEHAPAADAGE